MGLDVAKSEAQLRACELLLSQQCEDGGWGESYLSCQDKVLPEGCRVTCPARTRCSPRVLGLPVLPGQGAPRGLQGYLSCQDKVLPEGYSVIYSIS